MQMCEFSGATIEMWTSRKTWFWRVVRSGRDGGTIGAAATHTEALSDACLWVEEALGADGRTDAICAEAIGWERSLSSLERYLICGGDPFANY